jgi:hypothetical protein
MDLISPGTRRIFQEHLVDSSVLREIQSYFDDQGIPLVPLPPEKLPGGQRRGLIEMYYAGVNWQSQTDVRKVLKIFEDIIRRVAPSEYEPTPSRTFQKLNTALQRDGYVFEGTRDDGRLVSRTGVDLTRIADASSLVDRATLRDHIRRIEQSIDADPAQAIGSAKELVETAAKHVLEHYGDDPDAYDKFPRLVKAAVGKLDLSSDTIPDPQKSAQALAMLTGGLGQIAEATAAIRNLYGTGHGRTRTAGADGRHARLVVGACSTLAAFLLETLDARKTSSTHGRTDQS